MGNLGILIPIMIFAIPLLAIWTKHQQKIAELQARMPADDSALADAYASKVQALEDRVRVLERIVTDGGFNVAAQIEALRDAPATRTDAGVPLAPNKETV
jgi:hypothetical protein